MQITVIIKQDRTLKLKNDRTVTENFQVICDTWLITVAM